jgi:hypothetical protein
MDKPSVEEVRAEYNRRKGSPNKKSEITLKQLAEEMGYEWEDFKMLLMQQEQKTAHVSKSARRNRRILKRQALMRERYGIEQQ